ncbi:restriction endonuclease subunit S [Nostoc sp.]|uniref:restriction endonuclease subunit S n=1 Tax=Nostoc sp. TaxID=1180 RepID=UPI002FFD4555
MSISYSEPEYWVIALLGQVITYSNERINPSNNLDKKFFYVGLEHIERNTGQLVGATTVLGREIKSAKNVFQRSDILYGKLRPYLNKVYLAEVNGICSTDIWVLKPRPILYPEYLSYYLRSTPVLQRVTQVATGANLPRIDTNTFNFIPIPLPPLAEQRRIVDILREADELCCLRRQANEKAKQLIPSLFQEMLGEVDNSWEEHQLKDIIKKLSPGKSFAASSQPARNGKFGVLKVSAVTQGVFKPEENKELPNNISYPSDYEVEDGDLIISRANTQELVGASAIVRNPPRSLLRSDKLWKVVLHKKAEINVYFLWALLNTPKVRQEISNRSTGTSGSMRNISQDKFLDIQVKLPPKPLQDEFEEKVRLLWEQNDDQENSANKLDSLFQSLLAQAFTGELTSTWREQHQEELATAVELNQLLHISQPVDTEELADEEASETKTSELHRDRDELLRSLSKSQWKIYELVIQETVYFTPEHLEEKYSIPRNIGHKSLQLLAAAGLIIPVTLPTPTSSGLHYESAYRNLNQDDDTRYSDDALLEKDAV